MSDADLIIIATNARDEFQRCLEPNCLLYIIDARKLDWFDAYAEFLLNAVEESHSAQPKA